MKKFAAALIVVVVAAACLAAANADPLDEDFGYVDVRSGAHMFWVTYHTELPGDWSDAPLIMWLQGGPGASGVGFGNFQELGPYDTQGNLRPGRWTQKANVMFVDNPVGTGYSYVDNLNLLCKDNAQIADDLVALLTSVFADYPDMQKMPFFVYAESYGGKMTADFAIALEKAIANGEINCNFQGIAMGDSWVSPMDSVNTWGSFLYNMGIVNQDEQAAIDNSAAQTQRAVDQGNWDLATSYWSKTESVVLIQTGGVDFYNVLVPDSAAYAFKMSRADAKKYSFMKPEIRDLFQHHVLSLQNRDSLDGFMNGPQADAWGIPSGVVWGGQSGYVFNTLSGDFMKPVVTSVADLLDNSKIHVSVFTGDLDLICDTPGTYLWIANMEYALKSAWESTPRRALHVDTYPNIAAYVQRQQRFSVFTLLRSGHMSPIDVPQMALNMVDMITEYGAEAAAEAPVKATQKKEEEKEEPKNKGNVVVQAPQETPKKEQVKEAVEQKKEEQKEKKKEQVKVAVQEKKEQVKVAVQEKKEQVKVAVQEKKEQVKAAVEEKKTQSAPKTAQLKAAPPQVKSEAPLKAPHAATPPKPIHYERIELDLETSNMLKEKVFGHQYQVPAGHQNHQAAPAPRTKPLQKNPSPSAAAKALKPNVRELRSHVARASQGKDIHAGPSRSVFN